MIGHSPEDAEHIWIVTGPAGCGKTTVAKFLAWKLSLPYIEGDDHHPKANKDKMSNGIALTDADRWDWLITLRELAVDKLTTPSSDQSEHGQNNTRGVIITCSALKHKYRDVIRVAAYNHPHIQIHFIYLKANEALLQQRVASRQGHYMKSGMVHSQFENLEEPDHEGDVLIVDVDAAPEVVQEKALEVVKAKLKEYEPEDILESELESQGLTQGS
ncbi:putative thermoresistant gluconokinase family protein [Phaeomoniella chlamydospora]|uniref:Gluconokinase n=1 Tax=Phaeomoniella chlamydospora TaxID=158046 RepID=A0A0G2F2S8_PHACM|nr:putative thermoresistant gluconokinase family protein [Phaeomoniella chlamydospora]